MDGAASVKRPVGSARGAEELAMNYYELEPGERFAFGYHAHSVQEEIFVIIDRTATFETESGDVAVEAGELVRFAPGEFQQGRNETGDRVRALAIGAPAEMGDVTLLRHCEECGKRTDHDIEPTDDRSELLTICVACGTETGRYS